MPPSAHEALARDETFVKDATFDEGSTVSQDEAMATFNAEYDPSAYDHDPKPYAVVIESSTATDLWAGRKAWMVHVEGVERDITGPIGPPGADGNMVTPPQEVRISTDMFVFVDAESGEFVMTTYIGP